MPIGQEARRKERKKEKRKRKRKKPKFVSIQTQLPYFQIEQPYKGIRTVGVMANVRESHWTKMLKF